MDLNQIMQQAQQFQKKMSEMQEALAAQEMTSTVGGGMVSATVNGKHELLKITIDPEAIDPKDPAMLEDLIVAAVNDAMNKARQASEGEMGKLTGGLNLGNIPGLSGLFGK